jgi:hypothetical protein
MSGCVFDDNLLALVMAVMPRMQEPTMKAAVVSDYDLPHADPMARLHVVAEVASANTSFFMIFSLDEEQQIKLYLLPL